MKKKQKKKKKDMSNFCYLNSPQFLIALPECAYTLVNHLPAPSLNQIGTMKR